MNSHETTPVLICTDVGRDIDDAEAITYLAGSPNIEIVGLVTTHMIPDKRARIARAMLNELGNKSVPIGSGSVFPLGEENKVLNTYAEEHTRNGASYEGKDLIESFPDGVRVIGDAIDEYGNDLQIAALAPLTDLAKVAEHDPSAFRNIGRLHIQGQVLLRNGQLVPDLDAYNLNEDTVAADQIFELQDDVPMTFVGKHAAYQVPLTRNDFARFAATSNPVGAYLQTHALEGIAALAEYDSSTFERVFGVPVSQLDQIDELSKPYDALVALNIAKPGNLIATSLGHHSIIGMYAEYHGVKDPQLLKTELVNGITNALTHHS